MGFVDERVTPGLGFLNGQDVVLGTDCEDDIS